MSNNFSAVREERKRAASKLEETYELEREYCRHGRSSDAQTVPLKGSGIYGKEVTSQYPDTAVVCTGCRAIFDSRNLTRERLAEIRYATLSEIEQIKHLSPNLTEGDMEFLRQGYAAIKHLKRIDTYYLNMVHKLTSGGGKKKGGGDSKKPFGIKSGMYGRSY